VTGPADRPQQPGPDGPTGAGRAFPRATFGQAEPSGTQTADAAYPADSPVPYTLTAKAETLLGDVGSQQYLLRNAQTCDMRVTPPQAGSGLSGQPVTYITEISVPPSDSGIHRLHVRMIEPEPEPEAGL
jgi:hypothetical protein